MKLNSIYTFLFVLTASAFLGGTTVSAALAPAPGGDVSIKTKSKGIPGIDPKWSQSTMIKGDDFMSKSSIKVNGDKVMTKSKFKGGGGMPCLICN